MALVYGPQGITQQGGFFNLNDLLKIGKVFKKTFEKKSKKGGNKYTKYQHGKKGGKYTKYQRGKKGGFVAFPIQKLIDKYYVKPVKKIRKAAEKFDSW